MDNIKFVTPYKKPRGQQLTDIQRRYNTNLATVRSKVERVFGKVYFLNIKIIFFSLRINLGCYAYFMVLLQDMKKCFIFVVPFIIMRFWIEWRKLMKNDKI